MKLIASSFDEIETLHFPGLVYSVHTHIYSYLHLDRHIVNYIMLCSFSSISLAQDLPSSSTIYYYIGWAYTREGIFHY